MTQSTMYQFRLDANEKRQAFEVFDELGIKPAQAIRLFLRQVTATKSIPFDVAIPNATTQRAMQDVEAIPVITHELVFLRKSQSRAVDAFITQCATANDNRWSL